MDSAGTYEVNIEVRGVGQATPGLKIVCGGWKREARQDVGVGVRVLRSVLKRKSVPIQEVKPSLYPIALVRQTCKILKQLVVYPNLEGDSVEHLSVTLDGTIAAHSISDMLHLRSLSRVVMSR